MVAANVNVNNCDNICDKNFFCHNAIILLVLNADSVSLFYNSQLLMVLYFPIYHNEFLICYDE